MAEHQQHTDESATSTTSIHNTASTGRYNGDGCPDLQMQFTVQLAMYRACQCIIVQH